VGQPYLSLGSEAEFGGARRPAHAGPEPGARSRRAYRSASACRAVEVRRPAYAGPLHKTTRYPGGRFTRG